MVAIVNKLFFILLCIIPYFTNSLQRYIFFIDNVLNFIEVSKDFDINQIGQHKKKKVVGTFDLSMDFDFTGSKPKKISICGNDYRINDNKDVITTITRVLFEMYEEKMLNLAQKGWSPGSNKM